MFKHKKGLSLSLLTSLTLLSSFAEAVVPDAPGSYIGVTDINKTSVRVNFLDNADNEDGFLLFDKSEDINITIPKNSATASSQTYVTLTGLTCGRVYTLNALAFNSDGNSEMSDARSFNIETTFGVSCGNPLEPPIANAGEDKTVEVDTPITIIGSGTDNDGVIVSYKWEENDTEIAPTASFDYISSVEGVHTLVLTVTDDDGNTASDDMNVTVQTKEPIKDGLVAYYKFEGNANDSSGNGNDGVEHGGVSYADGVIGQAGTFDGMNDSISITSNDSLNITKAITMSAWIYIEKYSSSWAPILTKGDTSSMNSPYALLVYEQKLEIALNRNLLHLKENNVPNKEWTHIAITWDGLIVRYFINGIEESETRNFNNSLSVIDGNLVIGKDAPGSTEWFSGKIDELRLYNRALNEAEIKALYTSKYSYYDEQVSWTDAKKSCEEKNSHLATISSEEENNIIHKLIANGSQEVYYLGGTDEQSEGVWKWITDEGFVYTNWGSGEPNNLNDEDYLMIYKDDGTWNDLSLFNNNWRSIGYICEREI